MAGLLTPTSSAGGRRERRYSVRPFYVTLLLFGALVGLSWTFGPSGGSIASSHGARLQTRAAASILRRETDESKVSTAIALETSSGYNSCAN